MHHISNGKQNELHVYKYKRRNPKYRPEIAKTGLMIGYIDGGINAYVEITAGDRFIYRYVNPAWKIIFIRFYFI